MAKDLRTELVLAALERALNQRKPDGVIHHSDQGSQFDCLWKTLPGRWGASLNGFGGRLLR